MFQVFFTTRSIPVISRRGRHILRAAAPRVGRRVPESDGAKNRRGGRKYKYRLAAAARLATKEKHAVSLLAR
ncbi:hypothetical protein MY4038_006612 [Beauveria bassiana]